MRAFWVSWWSAGAFIWDGPWWISGARWDSEDIEQPSVCAAVMARDEGHVRELIQQAHDDKAISIEWRFIKPEPDEWDPFANDRFPRADWMRWPWPRE